MCDHSELFFNFIYTSSDESTVLTQVFEEHC